MAYHHTIFLDNDFVVHKRFIALHYAAPASEGTDTVKNIIDGLRALLGKESLFSIQSLSTEFDTWESVVKYDPYFETMYNIEYDGERSLKEFADICHANRHLEAKDVANLVLSRVECTQLKLQKLVYFCYADFLEKTGKELFREKPLTYRYGPVFKSLRTLYGSHENNVIPADRSKRRQDIVDSRFLAADITLQTLNICSKTINKYKDLSASELVALTHREDSPWSSVFQEGLTVEIPNEAIYERHHFESL